MPAPKLEKYMRRKLKEMVCDQLPHQVIMDYFAAQGWPTITHENIYYYNQVYGDRLRRAAAKRLQTAEPIALANKGRRLQVLQKVADGIEPYLFNQEKGRLVNIKLLLETLDDIAEELGDRPKLAPTSLATSNVQVVVQPGDVNSILAELKTWRGERFLSEGSPVSTNPLLPEADAPVQGEDDESR